MKFMKNIPKTYLFASYAMLSSLVFHISETAYMIFGIAACIIFFKKYYNFIIAVVFIAVHMISGMFFIALEVAEYKTSYIVKCGSGNVLADKNIKISAGDIIIGRFTQDKKHSEPFFKPVYTAETPVKIISSPVIKDILQFRNKISNRIFYASGGKITVAQALILGDKKYISNNMKDAYAVSGLAHLLAMSGTHVGIITAVIIAALFFLPIKLRFVFVCPALIFFMILGGFSITVVRASIFAIVMMTAYIFDIKINSKKFIFLIGGVFLLISPRSVSDISFLMSFGAVFGIIYMLNSGFGYIKTALITGIAATLITAPLSMYVFGMTNHLSIISTIIMAPVIYLHIMFAMFALICGNTGIAPLIIIETISNNTVLMLKDMTYFGFVFKKIPLWITVISVVYITAALFLKGRKKYFSLIALLIIFYPAKDTPDMEFPLLNGRDKGFLVFEGERKEIFYQGSLNGFKYKFMPITAKYGYKYYDYGSIKIFGGKNNYIKIKEIGTDFHNLCLNERNKDCDYFYHTRSNSVKKGDIESGITHILWKNNIKDESIIEIDAKGGFIINNSEIIFQNDEKGDDGL